MRKFYIGNEPDLNSSKKSRETAARKSAIANMEPVKKNETRGS